MQRSFLRDNGLSITLLALFLVFTVGLALTGWAEFNSDQRQHGQPEAGLVEYLKNPAFGEAVFENWESEFLQMGLYVLLTAFLFQRGSSESKDPDEAEEQDEDPVGKRQKASAPGPVRRGGIWLALYKHSLSLAFAGLFLISFAGHAIFGLGNYNEEAMEHGQPLLTLGGYLASSRFWFESFQNWQSEFLAVFAIVVLSIWLREHGSPESKPVAAPHHQTGG
jgi:hypothetical protein